MRFGVLWFKANPGKEFTRTHLHNNQSKNGVEVRLKW
jgi:hypothetical protein